MKPIVPSCVSIQVFPIRGHYNSFVPTELFLMDTSKRAVVFFAMAPQSFPISQLHHNPRTTSYPVLSVAQHIMHFGAGKDDIHYNTKYKKNHKK